MKKLLSILLLVGLLSMRAEGQRVYFMYLQSESRQPFSLTMDNKLYYATGSGYLIMSKLKDSTYKFKINFPGDDSRDLRFSVTIKGRDRGFLIRDLKEKGWGLYDLQTSSMQMEEPDPSGSSIRMEPRTDLTAFTRMLALAADDPTLLEKPVFIQAVAKEEVKQEVEEKKEPKTETETPKDLIAKNENEGMTQTIQVRTATEGTVQKKNDVVTKQETALKKEDIVPKKDDTSTKEETVQTKEDVIPKDEIIAKKEEPLVKEEIIPKKEDTTPQNEVGQKKKEAEPKEEVVAKKEEPVVKEETTPKKEDMSPKEELVQKKDEVVPKEETAPKKEVVPSKEIMEVKEVPIKEEPIAKEKPIVEEKITSMPYKPSKVTRRAESSTTEGFGLTFTDELSDGTVDTIRILIPNQRYNLVRTTTEPKDDKQFLDFTTEKKATEEKPAEKQNVGTTAKVNCEEMASENDLIKLRKRMSGERSDERMIAEAKRALRKKCITVSQVRNLSAIFTEDGGRYRFFDAIYVFVSDPENFSGLASEINDSYYLSRFKELFN